MYLFLTTSGEMRDAYEGFDPKDPDWEQLRDVQEIYYISKVLVPQLKLVPKTKEERQKIEASAKEPETKEPETKEPEKPKAKTQRKSKAKAKA